MSRIAFATLLFFAVLSGRAQDNAALAGRIEGDTYYSANGAYSVPIPVLPQLGGVVRDNRSVATFEDAFSTHVTIAAFPQDANQRWELSTRGVKEYLIYFFNEFVFRDFKAAYKQARVESSARFVPSLLGGALIAYVLLPGGSMFERRLHVVDVNWTPPVAKRGNLLFVKNGYIFVISIELAERVIEGSAYHKTSDEEDAILHDRLIGIAGKIQVCNPPPGPAETSK